MLTTLEGVAAGIPRVFISNMAGIFSVRGIWESSAAILMQSLVPSVQNRSARAPASPVFTARSIVVIGFDCTLELGGPAVEWQKHSLVVVEGCALD